MLLLLALVWFLNLGISIFNAVQTGKSWVEARHAGGGRRFMAWMGALMTAIGFTWCLMIVEGLLAAAFHWLDADHLELYLGTSYVLLIGPLLFAGYSITVNSWANAYRERTLQSVGFATYNSFASVYNTYNAVRGFGPAMKKMVNGFFKAGKNKDAAQLMIIVLMIIVAFGGGIVITYWIINKYAAADEPLPMRTERTYR